MTEDTSPSKERVTIILHSGAYDRVSYALCIVQAALASGMEAYMLLTFEGLKRFTKGHLTEIGDETPTTLRPHVEQGLEMGAIQDLEEQLAEVKKMGLKIYACPNTLASLNIPRHDLLAVDDVMGLVAFLRIASSASINWYI